MNYFYVYVIRSLKDFKFYTGYAKDLKLRFNAHNKGLVESTKNRRPFELVYFEGCKSKKDALHREKYLKTTYGKRYIKNRIQNFLNGLS